MSKAEKQPDPGGPGKGAAKCKADDMCDFLTEIAPKKPARQIPGAGQPFPGPNQPPAKWMEAVYKDIIDLWEAVQRLERMNHYNETSQQVGGAVIYRPPGGPGGPPQGAGSPPPPSFPVR